MGEKPSTLAEKKPCIYGREVKVVDLRERPFSAIRT
jgi:hypothetical protein